MNISWKTRLAGATCSVAAVLAAVPTTPAHAVYRRAMCVPYGQHSSINLEATTWIDSRTPNYASYHIDMDSYNGTQQFRIYIDGRAFSQTNDLHWDLYGKGKNHKIEGFWFNSPDTGVKCGFWLHPWP